jgi:hypothetical protein
VQTASERELLYFRHRAAAGGKIKGGAQAVLLRLRRGNLDAEVPPILGALDVGHTDVCADPMFVALKPGDFRLKPDSPALKMGSSRLT